MRDSRQTETDSRVAESESNLLKLGAWENRKKLIEALREKGFCAGDANHQFTEQLLEKMPLLSVPKTVRIVFKSIQELGFSKTAGYQEICDRRKQLRLGILPAQAGPELWMDSLLERLGEVRVSVAMAPIDDFYGNARIFEIRDRREKIYLSTRPVIMGAVWYADDCWAFAEQEDASTN